MVSSCIVYGCKNRKKKGKTQPSFHRFPWDRPKLLKAWIAAMRRKSWTPTKNSRICSDHFTDICFKTKDGQKSLLLNKDAVPTVFPGFHTHLQKTTKAGRILQRQPTEEFSSEETFIHGDNQNSFAPVHEAGSNFVVKSEQCSETPSKIACTVEDSNKTKQQLQIDNVYIFMDCDIQNSSSIAETCNNFEVKSEQRSEMSSNIACTVEDSNKIKQQIQIEHVDTSMDCDIQNSSAPVTKTCNSFEDKCEQCREILSNRACTEEGLNKTTQMQIEPVGTVTDCEIKKEINTVADNFNPSQNTSLHMQILHSAEISPTKVQLRKKIKLLQAKLRRRNKKINSMKKLIVNLKRQVLEKSIQWPIFCSLPQGIPQPTDILPNPFQNTFLTMRGASRSAEGAPVPRQLNIGAATEFQAPHPFTPPNPTNL